MSQIFSCEYCDYTTSGKTNYSKHLLICKNKNEHILEINTIFIPEKTPKLWICEKCNFVSKKQNEYNRHLTTNKHLRDTTIASKHICGNCEKEYNSYKSLWQHKKKCSQKPLENTFIPDTPNTVIDVSFIMSLVKDNQDFTKQMLDNQNVLINKVIELSREPNTVNNTNCNNTNNTNNNHFNLNLFLNETCKDAINITDFVKTIVSELQLEDLEETAKHGYVAGISRIFVNALSNLEVNKRPIHCTDIKRETVYIKNKNLWEKDNQENEKLKNVVDYVADANMRQIDDWKQQHPYWNNNNSEESKVLDKMYMAALGGMNEDEDDKNMKKVIKTVLQEVVIEKENNT